MTRTPQEQLFQPIHELNKEIQIEYNGSNRREHERGGDEVEYQSSRSRNTLHNTDDAQ